MNTHDKIAYKIAQPIVRPNSITQMPISPDVLGNTVGRTRKKRENGKLEEKRSLCFCKSVLIWLKHTGKA